MSSIKRIVLYSICIISHTLLHAADKNTQPIYPTNTQAPLPVKQKSWLCSIFSFNRARACDYTKISSPQQNQQESYLKLLWNKIKKVINTTDIQTRNHHPSQAFLKEAQKNVDNAYQAREKAWEVVDHALRAKKDTECILNNKRKVIIDKLYETIDPIEKKNIYDENLKEYKKLEKLYDRRSKTLRKKIKDVYQTSNRYKESKEKLDALIANVNK